LNQPKQATADGHKFPSVQRAQRRKARFHLKNKKLSITGPITNEQGAITPNLIA